MTPTLLKRLFGVVAEQVEAFERRQDRRMDALAAKIAGLGKRQDRENTSIINGLAELSRRLGAAETSQTAAARDLAGTLKQIGDALDRRRAERRISDERGVELLQLVAALERRAGEAEQRRAGEAEQRGREERKLIIAEIERATGRLGQALEAGLERAALEAGNRDVGASTTLALDLAAQLDEQLEVRQRRTIRATVDAVVRTMAEEAGRLVDINRDQLADVQQAVRRETTLQGVAAVGKLEALEASLGEQRDRIEVLAASLADKPEVRAETSDADGLLSEVRRELGRLGQRLERERLEAESGRRALELRLDGIEASVADLGHQRPADQRSDAQARDVDQIWSQLEGLQLELRAATSRLADRAEGERDSVVEALEERLWQAVRRLESHGATADMAVVQQQLSSLEDAVVAAQRPLWALLKQFGDDGTPRWQRELSGRLEALEAGLTQLRDTAAGRMSHGDPAAAAWRQDVTRQLDQTTGELDALRLTVARRAGDEGEHRLQLRDDLQAVEGALADQQHALHKLVTSHDSTAYALRLELHRRLSDLNLSVAAQRRELSSSHTALEAGMSDQRYALHKLVTHLADDDGEDRSEWDTLVTLQTPLGDVDDDAPAVQPRSGARANAPPAAHGRLPDGIEQTLGRILDCLLANHIETVGRLARDDGDLEPAAFDQLVQALDEMKLDRLGPEHHTQGINRKKGKTE